MVRGVYGCVCVYERERERERERGMCVCNSACLLSTPLEEKAFGALAKLGRARVQNVLCNELQLLSRV
jgi:altronate dehydratase